MFAGLGQKKDVGFALLAFSQFHTFCISYLGFLSCLSIFLFLGLRVLNIIYCVFEGLPDVFAKVIDILIDDLCQLLRDCDRLNTIAGLLR
jgi:hypothetical protein